MGLWQKDAAAVMESFLRSAVPVNEISFYGSALDVSQLDEYSDLDMSVTLADGFDFNFIGLIKAFDIRFGVLGYETHENNGSDLLRICFKNGWRFDISFHCIKTRTEPAFASGFAEKANEVINRFWFMAVMVWAKMMRGDYLIAAHLGLGLYQQVIVLQMLVRDREKGTAIHRFGDKEYVPALEKIFNVLISGGTKEKIMLMLYKSAELMDEAAAELGYAPRTGMLRKLTG